MKIAFIVTNFPSLSETFVLNQITGLLDLGHEVEIFARKRPYGKAHSDIENYKLMSRVHYINPPKSLSKRFFKAINLMIANFTSGPTKILKSLDIINCGKEARSLNLLFAAIAFLDKDFDIIYCQFGHNGNIGACLKQIGCNGKLVTMFHGRDTRRGIAEGASLYRKLFEVGDCFLAISDYNYKNLIRFGVDPTRVILHPVGINVEKFPYRWHSGVERPSPIIIITVARLAKTKGLHYGIKAISDLIRESPGIAVEYRIVGGGPLETSLKRYVEGLNLGKHVRFLGPMKQEEVIQEMLKAHIFLLPSIAEALPVVLMEAQCIGLPIVATSVGSVHQEVLDGKSGFLVSTKDVKTMTEKLDYLIKHPEVWAEMGRTGREFICEQYDVQKLNRRLVRIYESLASREES